MISHIFKIPTGFVVTRHAALPIRMMHCWHIKPIERFFARYVRQSKAFSCEFYIRQANIWKITQVCTQTIIMTYASIWLKRHISSNWRVFNVRDIRTIFFAKIFYDFWKQNMVILVFWQAKHSCLLIDFTTAAQNSNANIVLRAQQKLRYFFFDLIDKWFRCRIVKVWKHKVLPNHYAKFIT